MVRPSWEPKISLGNLLTIIGMLVAATIAWGAVTERVGKVEVKQVEEEKRMDRFEGEVVDRLKRIENKLDRR